MGMDNEAAPLAERQQRLKMSSTANWVAVVAAAGVAGMATFQILLAVGVPLGHAAFGGANAVLPAKLRGASAISALVFVAAFYVVLARAGLLGVARGSLPVRVGIWVLAVIVGLSTLANGVSHSRWERFLMAPIGLVLTACFVVVALA
jgi:hypothetical protein